MEDLSKLKIDKNKIQGAGIYKIQYDKYVFIGSTDCLYKDFLQHLNGERLNGATKQMLMTNEGEMTLLKEINLNEMSIEQMKKEEQLYVNSYAMNYLNICLNCYTQNIISEELRKENLTITLNRLIEKINHNDIELTENQCKYIKSILNETINRFRSDYFYQERE